MIEYVYIFAALVQTREMKVLFLVRETIFICHHKT